AGESGRGGGAAGGGGVRGAGGGGGGPRPPRPAPAGRLDPVKKLWTARPFGCFGRQGVGCFAMFHPGLIAGSSESIHRPPAV
ncbi:hypothetical protein M3398_23680, partial [Streptomyces albidoflavus]|nr:hypothetical protein [Streptomyces albidoflavus]